MGNAGTSNKYLSFILFFVIIRVALNLFAISHYGFQRDELLHLALGDHLDWGFKEVPPFIALLAKISLNVFGDSVAAARIFTTVGSGAIILLTGLLTVEMGGKRFAITLACLSLTFSPAFLASGYLFQPVVFDQLWWLLSVYLLVKFINSENKKYLYFLGLTIGLGLLTKYTMAFFAVALVAGLLFTPQRKMLFTKPVLIATAIAFVVFLPNIIWQLAHHLPLVTHMQKLRSTQLDYVKPSDFLSQQLLVNGTALVVWLAGLIGLLFSSRLIRFRFLGFAYLVTLVLFVVLRGKNYYLFGAYPMLFAAGATAFELWLKKKLPIGRTLTILFVTVPNLVFLPLFLPIVPVKKALPLFGYIANNIGVRFPFKWEDQQMHPLTQDYGDMLGWDELGEKTARAYFSLPLGQQQQTTIFAENYGEAGAIHHYGKACKLPDVVCLNSSFALWAPDSLTTKYVLFVDERGGLNIKNLASLLKNYRYMGEITNSLAREKGTAIYFIEPNNGFYRLYRDHLLKTRME